MPERQTIHILPSPLKRLPAASSQGKLPARNYYGLVLLISVLLLALAGCVQTPDATAKQLVEAINAQKTDAALNLFSNGAVVSVDGSGPFSGKPEIKAWLEGLISDDVQLTLLEVLGQGEKSLRSRYSLATASAKELGVAPLEGTAEINTTPEGKIAVLRFSLSEESQAELLKAQLRKGIPVLSYAVLTDPDPVRASPGEGYSPNQASLTVLITNETGDQVPVRKITFRLPEGPNARDLTPNISGVISAAPTPWNLTREEGRFILEPELPEDGMLDPGQGLFITFSEILINDKPGVWGLEIVEETGESTTASMTVPLVKSPFALFVSDLFADRLVVEPGESITLYWEGSDGAAYSLYDGSTTTTVSNVDSVTVENLTQTTTFYLTATLVGNLDLPDVIRERTVTVIAP